MVYIWTLQSLPERWNGTLRHTTATVIVLRFDLMGFPTYALIFRIIVISHNLGLELKNQGRCILSPPMAPCLFLVGFDKLGLVKPFGPIKFSNLEKKKFFEVA
jgi:hypothetical protein